MITKKDMLEIQKDLSKINKDNVLYFLLYKAKSLSSDTMLRIIKDYDDKEILLASYLVVRSMYSRYINKSKISNKSIASIIEPYFPDKILEVADDFGDINKTTIIRTILGKKTPNAYGKIMARLNDNSTPFVSEIRGLSKEEMDKIFNNYKTISHKTRLYSLSLNEHFNDNHLKVAIRYIGFASFDVNGSSSDPIPFKTSYFKQIPSVSKKMKLISLIAEAGGYNDGLINYGAWASFGRTYIKLEKDASREEIERSLFLLQLKDDRKYKTIMSYLGYYCIDCHGFGFIVCKCRCSRWRYDKKNKQYGYFPSKNCQFCGGSGTISEECKCKKKK